jgi:hypothetical protein
MAYDVEETYNSSIGYGVGYAYGYGCGDFYEDGNGYGDGLSYGYSGDGHGVGDYRRRPLAAGWFKRICHNFVRN